MYFDVQRKLHERRGDFFFHSILQGSNGFDTAPSSGAHFFFSPQLNILDMYFPREIIMGYCNKKEPEIQRREVKFT